jgi:hypothetical protein
LIAFPYGCAIAAHFIPGVKPDPVWKSMELQEIVDRFAQGIPIVDATTVTENLHRRSKQPFLRSAFSLRENQLVNEVTAWWGSEFSEELPNFSGANLEFAYPGQPGNFCDLVIGSVPEFQRKNEPFEWAIEVKRIQLVGDNGKNNDYGITKLISPYRKDRSVIHDADRLSTFVGARRLAVIVYGFDFSAGAEFRSLQACKRLRVSSNYSEHLATVLKFESPKSPCYRLDAAIDIAEIALRQRGLVNGSRRTRRFSFWETTRHPCGAEGVVVAWEISTSTHSCLESTSPSANGSN